MIVVGIDSAETSGLAVVVRDGAGERLLFHGSTQIRTAADVAAVVDQLAAYAPDLVAVEEPFVHPAQPLAGLVLARLCGRWLQALEGRGLATVTVPASMWQTRVLPGITSRSRSPERKAAAVALAQQRFGVQVTEDEADAIALALYVVRNATRRAA